MWKGQAETEFLVAIGGEKMMRQEFFAPISRVFAFSEVDVTKIMKGYRVLFRANIARSAMLREKIYVNLSCAIKLRRKSHPKLTET